MNKNFERSIKQMQAERRKFLDMLGKAGVSAGLLRASAIAGGMMSSRFAQAATSDKKFILLFHPNGAPRGYTSSIAMNPLKPFGNTVAALTMSIGKPGNHGNLQFAAGADSYNGSDARSTSIDLQVAKVLGNNTPKRAIQLGVQSGAQEGINRLNGANVTRIDSPATALQQIFSGTSVSTSSSSGGTTGPTPTERKLSIVDANKQGLDALRNKLGYDERYRLDAHLDTITQLETRLKSQATTGSSSGGTSSGGTTGGSCSKPTIASSKSALAEYRMQGDIAVAALSCGITNVVSIQFNETQASWLPGDGTADAVPFNADHHQVNHGGQALNLLPAVCEYMNKGVANIIDKLQKAGIYNNTVVLCVSEMGDGVNHTPDAGPIIVASGISGLRGGFRAVGGDHYNVFPDVFKLLGVQGSAGIASYGNGGIVT